MPPVGATPIPFIPSPAQVLKAAPNAFVALLALTSVANARGVSNAAQVKEHGGPYSSETDYVWRSKWEEPLQRCRNEARAYRFEPNPVIADCLAAALSDWEKRSGDPYASTVVARALSSKGLDAPSPPDQNEGLKPGVPTEALNKATGAVRTSNRFKEIMASANALFVYYSTTRDSPDPSPPYTTASLRRLLTDAGKLDSFKREAGPLSFLTYEMISEELDNIFILDPKLMPSATDLADAKQEVARFFAASPDGSFSDPQLSAFLYRLASYKTAQPSRIS